MLAIPYIVVAKLLPKRGISPTYLHRRPNFPPEISIRYLDKIAYVYPRTTAIPALFYAAYKVKIDYGGTIERIYAYHTIFETR